DYRFSLLTLSARNFKLENIQKIIDIYTFKEITDYVFVVGDKNQKDLLIKNYKFYNGKVTINPEPKDVLYSSIKIGLKAVSRNIDFIILQFISLIRINKGTIEFLIERTKLTEKDIIIPTFNKRRGHPIIFKSKLIPIFNSLRKEKGLPYLIKNYKDCIEEVEVSDENILK
ncbi:MAG: NTP transferase domain-containing protein, partial [Caldisericia bacterium]